MSIYLAWLGGSDLRALRSPDAGPGPSRRALGEIARPRRLVLLGDVRTEDPTEIRRAEWGRVVERLAVDLGIARTRIDLRLPVLVDPTDLDGIYRATREALDAALDREGPSTPVTLNLSGGTPAMSTVLLLVAATRANIRPLKCSPEKGVQPVEIPFDLSIAVLREVAAAFAGQRPAPSRARLARLDADILRTPAGPMDAAVDHALRVAAVDAPVVIHGETGTGKELIARLIHTASARWEGPFVAVNGGALPETLVESALFGHEKGAFTGASRARRGHFEEADGGTLFLDEIADLSASTQLKLLRALQEGVVRRLGGERDVRVNVRVVAASHAALPAEVAAGRFRADLMYRLLVGRVCLPPLRDRGADIDLIADHVLDRINRECAGLPGFPVTLGDAARTRLRAHPWPGNVRELSSTLFRAALGPRSGSTLTPAALEAELLPVGVGDLDPETLPLDPPVDRAAYLRRVERRLCERALGLSGGVQRRAAERLGTTPQAFSKILKRHGLVE